MATLDGVSAKYGEEPNQFRIEQEGNDYLAPAFPVRVYNI